MNIRDDTTSIRRDPGDDSWHMNEPTDHRGLRVLGFEDCLQRLRTTKVGRLAFVSEGEPVLFPVNHAVDGVDVVFRTSWGSKLQVAEASGTVAFEVDGFDVLGQSGWSVLVKGTAELVDETVDIDRYDQLGLPSSAALEGIFWVRVRPIEITGREILPPLD